MKTVIIYASVHHNNTKELVCAIAAENDIDVVDASCYYHSLKLAMEKGIKKIAFPSISTGVYGFPVKLAAHIAVNVVARFEQEFPKQIEEIYFVLFDRDTEAAYEKEVDKLY